MTKKEIFKRLDDAMLRYMNRVIADYAISPELIHNTVNQCIGLVDSAYYLDVISYDEKMVITEQLINLVCSLTHYNV